MDELSEDDKLTVARARKIQKFMSQVLRTTYSLLRLLYYNNYYYCYYWYSPRRSCSSPSLWQRCSPA